jgi:hypothetical protein
MMVSQVGNGTLEVFHAALHVGIIHRHVSIQVVRGFTKLGHVARHDGEIARHVFIFLINACLKQCEAFIELLTLGPKVVLGVQPVVVVEDVASSCAWSPSLGMVEKIRAMWLMLVERPYPLI